MFLRDQQRDHIFRVVFELEIFVLLGCVVVAFVEPLDFVGVVFVFDEEEPAAVLVEAISVKPPASVNTHIAENSGCAPHEIPATL